MSTSALTVDAFVAATSDIEHIDGDPLIDALVVVEHEGENITNIREADGFVNATKLCKAGGKSWGHYFENDNTHKFFRALAKRFSLVGTEEQPKRYDARCPILQNFVMNQRGGNPNDRGKWVHPEVAVHLASWISPEAAKSVSRDVTRFLSGQVTTADSQAKTVVMASNVVILDNQGVPRKYVPSVSTLQIDSGPLNGFDSPGVYLIEYGDKLLYNMENVHENAKVIGFGHAKISGSARCNDHKIKTGPSTRVLDYIPTPFYEQCEKRLENRLKAKCKIVKGKIVGTTTEMREQFFVQSTEEYDSIVQSLRYDADEQQARMTCTDPLILEQEKTKQRNLEKEIKMAEKEMKMADIEANIAIAKEKSRQLELEMSIALSNEKVVQMKLELKRLENGAPPIVIEESLIEELEPMASTSEWLNVPEEPENPEPVDLPSFIAQMCILREDTPSLKCRIKLRDLYAGYKEAMKNAKQPIISEGDVGMYMSDVMKLEKKGASWHSKTFLTIFGIQLRVQPISLVEKTLKAFIEQKCTLGGDECIIDTKFLYDNLIEYADSTGASAIKYNGFTPQNMRTMLLKRFENITYKKYAINGKKNAYVGVKLKNMLTLEESVSNFVKEHCIVGYGYRVLRTEIRDACFKYIRDHQIMVQYTRTKFYSALKKVCPDLTEKCITQCDKGFIGITFKHKE